MKLGFCLFKYFPYGGLQQDCLSIAEECQARGHEIFMYTCNWQGDRPPSFTVREINCEASSNHRKYQRYHKQAMARIGEDGIERVIGFNKMPGLDVYFASDPSYAARRHGVLARLMPRYRHFMAFESAVFSPQSRTQILVLSDPQQSAYQQAWGTSADRFTMMPPGINPDACADEHAAEHRQRVRAEFNISDEELLLLMIGSGFRTKGLDRALQALQALPDELRKRTRMVVIGQDKAAPFERMIASMGLAGQVRILPGRSDIPAVMQAGDVLVHPAYSEVAGKVILEAVVAGLPVIVTEVCGYAHHVTDAEAGIVLHEPFCQPVFNRRLQQMLEGQERQRWRDNGIRYGRSQSLYSMAAAAADAIESTAI